MKNCVCDKGKNLLCVFPSILIIILINISINQNLCEKSDVQKGSVWIHIVLKYPVGTYSYKFFILFTSLSLNIYSIFIYYKIYKIYTKITLNIINLIYI